MVLDLEKRINAYELYLKLDKEKFTNEEMINLLQKNFGVNNQRIYDWNKGITPFGKKSSVKICPELFYVIGAILGDGCIYKWKNNYQVWLMGDENFTKKYAKKISICKSSIVKNYKRKNKNFWFVQIGNIQLFFLIKKIRKDMYVLENLLQEGNYRENALNFIEGFFDAEGCVKIIKEPCRKTPKICPDICNTDFKLINFVKSVMDPVLEIESRFSNQKAYIASDGHPRKKSYHLRIYKKEYVKKFFDNISTNKLTKEKEKYVENWLSSITA